VRDAYLNYQKALLQASTAQTEAEYRRREVEVLKVRAQTGDGGFSNIMEALVNLSRAQTNFTQALANYYIFLANLKKATGYGVNI
jgi:outer membrane protein TolC